MFQYIAHNLRPNKKISVFRVTGLKILGKVGTHLYALLVSGEIQSLIWLLKGIFQFCCLEIAQITQATMNH